MLRVSSLSDYRCGPDDLEVALSRLRQFQVLLVPEWVGGSRPCAALFYAFLMCGMRHAVIDSLFLLVTCTNYVSAIFDKLLRLGPRLRAAPVSQSGTL